jgi:hypothetical protein
MGTDHRGHRDLRWLVLKELSSLDWAEADLPIVERLTIKGKNEYV